MAKLTFDVQRFANINNYYDSYVESTSSSYSIYNESNYATIYGGNGNDSIDNHGDHVNLSGGYGNDTIKNSSSGDYSSLSGGNGADSINAGYNSYSVTLNGGYGNDTLVGSTSSYGDVFQFGNHDDYDVITNYSTNDTIHLTGISYLDSARYYNVGNDKVISLSSDGVITVKGGAYKDIKVKLGSYGSVATIYSGAENYYGDTDIIPSGDENYNSNYYYTTYNSQYLSASSSNDSMYNNYSYATLSAGSGNDTINNSSYGDYSSLSGGNGADSINAGYNSYSVTLNGGYGNDTLVGSSSTSYGDIFQFGNHDDYDVITNYSTNDTIHLTGISYLSAARYYNVGNDKVISLSSDGVITVKGGAYKNIKVKLGYPSIFTSWFGFGGGYSSGFTTFSNNTTSSGVTSLTNYSNSNTSSSFNSFSSLSSNTGSETSTDVIPSGTENYPSQGTTDSNINDIPISDGNTSSTSSTSSSFSSLFSNTSSGTSSFFSGNTSSSTSTSSSFSSLFSNTGSGTSSFLSGNTSSNTSTSSSFSSLSNNTSSGTSSFLSGNTSSSTSISSGFSSLSNNSSSGTSSFFSGNTSSSTSTFSGFSSLFNSNNYEERWFIEDDNFASNELDSIIDNSEIKNISTEDNLFSLTNPLQSDSNQMIVTQSSSDKK